MELLQSQLEEQVVLKHMELQIFLKQHLDQIEHLQVNLILLLQKLLDQLTLLYQVNYLKELLHNILCKDSWTKQP